MLAKGDKEDEFCSDDEDCSSHMTSGEEISQLSLASNTASPRVHVKSNLTSPGASLNQELETLLLEEAKKQGIFDVDAVRTINT